MELTEIGKDEMIIKKSEHQKLLYIQSAYLRGLNRYRIMKNIIRNHTSALTIGEYMMVRDAINDGD
jgi:hypothetical protein